MKKLSIISFLLIAVAFNFSACKADSKKENTKDIVETKKSTAPFAVSNAENDINFVAYKTTEKVGVNGWFTKVDVLSGGEGNSVKEAIHNTEFSIPISSLYTKDTSRDYKIRKNFFGMMDNTDILSGKLMISDETSGTAEVTMNGETKQVPFTYTIVDRKFSMNAIIDVNDWNAGKALATLNKVCEFLHTGADGVSKTWSEVALNITSTF